MKKQLISMIFAITTALALIGGFFVTIRLLNLFPLSEKIVLQLLPVDVLVGLTIYLKTSIDFALFTGNLMRKFQDFQHTVAIEIGTALGNGLGTLLVLIVWVVFKEVPLLLFFMVLLASLVLLNLAQESAKEYVLSQPTLPKISFSLLNLFYITLNKITVFLHPLLKFFIPKLPEANISPKSFFSLFLFAISVPFILGLDDFAGYIPLFSIVHIFGFCVGVILGHLLLTLSLFAFPKKTILVMQYPIIQLVGSVIFVGLAIFGIIEAIHMLIPLITTAL